MPQAANAGADNHIYPDLGVRVRQLMAEADIKCKEVIAAVAPHFGVKPLSLNYMIVGIREGCVINLWSAWDNPGTRRKDLERAAAALHYIGMPPNDPILDQIRRDHPEFTYPPAISLSRHNEAART